MVKKIELSDNAAAEITGQLCERNKPVDKVTQFEDLVGSLMFFRTVTYHLVGKVVNTLADLDSNTLFLELANASWVADSGRFMQAIKEGKLNEVEPVGKCWVNVGSITDMFPWVHELPQTQK